MNLLLDEQLDTADGAVAGSLNAFSKRTGLVFRALRNEAGRGLSDEEVIEYCKREGIAAVVSFNHRDFGKKKALYLALIEAGVSVVVLRPPKQIAFTPERQAGLILQHSVCMDKHLTATALLGPTLLRLSPTDCRQRSLEELEAEFTDDPRKLP